MQKGVTLNYGDAGKGDFREPVISSTALVQQLSTLGSV